MNDVEPLASSEDSFKSTSSVLNHQATSRVARLLFSHGLIDDGGRREALRLLHGPIAWWLWVERALLFLGLVLVLAGVICFFAWNWAGLHPFVKLGLIEAAILLSCAVAWWRGLDSLIGRAAQLGGAVFVGVFLAVYGQIYQTGADAYELFVGWALLILPWTVLARFAGLWIFWIGLVNVALGLAWDQVLRGRGFGEGYVMILLALVNASGAALRELGWRRGWSWLHSHWTRWLLMPATLGPLMISAVQLIVDGLGQQLDRLAAVAVLAALLPLVVWYFRKSAPDLLSLTYAVTCVCTLLDFVIGRVLFVDLEIDEVGGFLLMGCVIVGTVSVATLWLLREFRKQRAARKSEISDIGDSPIAAEEVISTPDAEPRQLSAVQLLANLRAGNHLSAPALEQATKLLMEESEDDTPWFVSALVGFGAWVACLCFVVCAGIAGLFNHMATAGVFGLVLTVGSVALDRLIPHLFARQFALATGLAGYVMVMIATADRHVATAAAESAVLSVLLYPVARSSVYRFLLACAPQFMFVIASWEWGWRKLQNSADVVHVLVLVQTAAVGAIFAWRPKQFLWPAGYSFAVGLLATLVLTTSEFRQMAAWPSSVIQVAAEIWLIAWLMSAGRRRDPTLMLLAAGACAVIGVLSAPGVLAAIGILLLGHLERDNLLRSLGLLFLPVYLVAFYYDLNTTLLVKSGMLVGSGLVLWLGCSFARRQLVLQTARLAEESVA